MPPPATFGGSARLVTSCCRRPTDLTGNIRIYSALPLSPFVTPGSRTRRAAYRHATVPICHPSATVQAPENGPRYHRQSSPQRPSPEYRRTRPGFFLDHRQNRDKPHHTGLFRRISKQGQMDHASHPPFLLRPGLDPGGGLSPRNTPAVWNPVADSGNGAGNRNRLFVFRRATTALFLPARARHDILRVGHRRPGAALFRHPVRHDIMPRVPQVHDPGGKPHRAAQIKRFQRRQPTPALQMPQDNPILRFFPVHRFTPSIFYRSPESRAVRAASSRL